MKFLVTGLNDKENKCAVLAVECNEDDPDKIKEVRDIADAFCKIVINSEGILYLNRKAIPWEERRELERAAHDKGREEVKEEGDKLYYKLVDLMSSTYKKICLLETEYTQGKTVGSYIESCRKKGKLDFNIVELHVVKI